MVAMFNSNVIYVLGSSGQTCPVDGATSEPTGNLLLIQKQSRLKSGAATSSLTSSITAAHGPVSKAQHGGAWVLGFKGESCEETCRVSGSKCDSSEFAKRNEEIASEVKMA